jgi:hypothetical protein
VLRALPDCPHLRKVDIMTKYASADAMKNLLLVQLRPATELRLVLEMDHWLAVANEIRQGRCKIKSLNLAMLHVSSSRATEAVKALASVIHLDRNLKHLALEMEDGFTDEAGVALAEALMVNNTLIMITLSDNCTLPNTAALGAQAYVAFSAMLRVNTSLVLKIPLLDTGVRDKRLRESRQQMRIEQRLNQVGRGKLLSSSQTTREEWVDALHELNSSNVAETPEFNVSCLYSALRSNPTTVYMS